jgi:benzoate membrane transport protein
MSSANLSAAVDRSVSASRPGRHRHRLSRFLGAGYLREFRVAAVWTGLTACIWYGFGALPVQLEVAGQLDITTAQKTSWIFIIWFSCGVASIMLSLWRRIPAPMGWTIPGLIYLGTLSGQFTFAEMVGANLVAGVAIVLLGVLGFGRRIMTWLPLPIIMGMFAGSIFAYMTRMVNAIVEDMLVAGLTAASYLIGRCLGSPRVPPMALAVIVGGFAVFLFGDARSDAMTWRMPDIELAEAEFTFHAFLAVSLPMVVLTMGLGNVQGLGFLMSQGYRVPVTRITVATGICSIVNAMFGGHAATIARTGAAILAGPEAGPAGSRYWANLIAGALCLAIAVCAAPLASLLDVLPRTFVVTLAALAILSSLQDALAKAFGGKLRFGGLAAFAVAATPFAVFGITSAFWAILAGLGASLAAERQELLAHWRGDE